MTGIQAVVFDIGGVLEITPDLGLRQNWEPRLGLAAGELDERMYDVWLAGNIGTITLNDVHQALTDRLNLDERQLAAFMDDIWREYLGTANAEQTAYGFEDLVDELVYSHEVGISKPDPRIYALTCERLAVRPEQTVFVDDVEANLTAARDAGLHPVHHQDNARTIAAIEKLL